MPEDEEEHACARRALFGTGEVCNLESSFDKFEPTGLRMATKLKIYGSATRWCGCLSKTVQRVHDRLIKLMDVEPRNILIKNRQYG